jgi:allantoate deiminase
MTRALPIDPAEVAWHVERLAHFGAHGATGVWRTVYSPEWTAAQQQLAEWFQAAGLSVRQDAVGNLWGRLEGSAGCGVIATGSHVDSQRPGGQYDGALGIIAGLLAVKHLRQTYGSPRRPLEVVSLCEEESSRFPTAAYWGSRAITGQVRPADLTEVRDFDGVPIADVMRGVGLDPDRVAEAVRHDLDAFIELHIEQGPFLEDANLPVAIVSGITGMRHYLVTLTGRADHAGAVPMDRRLDPMAGAAEIISGVIGNAFRLGRPAVTTVGQIRAEPGGRAIVPDRVIFTVDARHPVPEQRAELYRQHESLIREVAARRGLRLTLEIMLDIDPAPSDPAIMALHEASARGLEIPCLVLPSGAGHDSQRMATICRTGMLFVQSRDGRSHTPDEYTAPEHAAAGIAVLAATLHGLAYDE